MENEIFDKEFFTLSQIAFWLGITEKEVEKLFKKLDVPIYLVGGEVKRISDNGFVEFACKATKEYCRMSKNDPA